MPTRRRRSQKRRNPPPQPGPWPGPDQDPEPESELEQEPQPESEPEPQPEAEAKKSLSLTSLCRCSRFLSHHCQRSLPPNCTSCSHCLRSQRLEELESWDKILDEEFETRFKDLNLVVDMLPISMDKLNIMFRLEEIKTMTGDHLDALLKKKSLTNPENAEKARALLQHEAVENLYGDEKESLNREFEELRLKKEQMERNIAMIPKASKFLSDATRKRKDGDVDDDTATIKIV